MESIKQIEIILCHNTKPIYVGNEIKGYLIKNEDMLSLLTILNGVHTNEQNVK